MTRRVPLLAMLCAVLGVLVGPSFAATDEGILLRGNGTAYIDLTVYVAATVSAADLQMHTRGSYVGFFLSPAPANRDTVGALVMPRVGATGQDSASTMRLGASWDVQPGRYRAFLLTDGPADVFIPIKGQGYRGWVPRGRAPLSVRRTDFDVAAGSTGRTSKVAMTLRARSLVIVSGLATSSSLTAVDNIGACVTTSPDGCPVAIEANARVPAARQWAYAASLVKPGTYAGYVSLDRVLGPDAGSHVAGTLAVLTIGLQT